MWNCCKTWWRRRVNDAFNKAQEMAARKMGAIPGLG